jgi:hypothetical protein
MASINALTTQLFRLGTRLENVLISSARGFIQYQNLLLLGAYSLLVNPKRGTLQKLVGVTLARSGDDVGTSSRSDGTSSERGDVPGWVLVVLMTAGLVTGIWTVAAPRLNQILRTSLDSMNSIR